MSIFGGGMSDYIDMQLANRIRCTVCGTDVPNGMWHSCGGTPTYRAAETISSTNDKLDEIIRLLKKLTRETP